MGHQSNIVYFHMNILQLQLGHFWNFYTMEGKKSQFSHQKGLIKIEIQVFPRI